MTVEILLSFLLSRNEKNFPWNNPREVFFVISSYNCLYSCGKFLVSCAIHPLEMLI